MGFIIEHLGDVVVSIASWLAVFALLAICFAMYSGIAQTLLWSILFR